MLKEKVGVLVNVLENLLLYENESSVLNYHFHYNNILVWPFIRFYIFKRVYYEINKINQKKIYKENVPYKNNLTILQKYYRNVKGNPFFTLPKDIMFLYDGSSFNYKLENGRYRNRIVDDYILLNLKQTYKLEDSSLNPWENRIVPSIKFRDYIDYRIEKKSQSERPCQADINMSNLVITYLKQTFPFDMNNIFWSSVKANILYYANLIKYQEKYYDKLFCLVKPKIVFVTCGCHGGPLAYILNMLYERHIPCVELQHGWVGKQHEAYNYSNQLYESQEYISYMPQIFALFGQYWGNQIRLPIRKYVLGNSQFEKSTRKYSSKKINNKRILFIAGEGNDLYDKLLSELLPILKQPYILEFRVHPELKIMNKLFEKYKSYKNFELCSGGSIYEAIHRCEYATGDGSTGLFEAAAMQKKVFIFKNDYNNGYDLLNLGPTYQNAEQFIKILQNAKFNTFLSENFFCTDWERKYKKLVHIIAKSN